VLSRTQEKIRVSIPAARSDLVARLHERGRVLETAYVDGRVEVTALVPPKLAGQIRKALAEAGEPAPRS